MRNKILNEASYTIKFKCASYDKLPSKDEIVDSLIEGIEGDFPNITSDIKISINKK